MIHRVVFGFLVFLSRAQLVLFCIKRSHMILARCETVKRWERFCCAEKRVVLEEALVFQARSLARDKTGLLPIGKPCLTHYKEW